MVIIAILAAILLPVFAAAREKARQASCASNEKQLGLALMQYVQDYDECYPPMDIWSTVDNTDILWQPRIYSYVKSAGVYVCPDYPDSKVQAISAGTIVPGVTSVNSTYAANCSLGNGGNIFDTNLGAGLFSHRGAAGVNIAKVVAPATTVEVFEADNSGDERICIDSTNNPNSSGTLWNGHRAMGNYLFADGHVKSMNPAVTIANGINRWTRDNLQSGPLCNATCWSNIQAFVANGIANYPS